MQSPQTCPSRHSSRRRSRRLFLGMALLSLVAAAVTPAHAENRFVVRAQEGVDGVQTVTGACVLLGCQVRYSLDGALNGVFLVTTADTVNPAAFLGSIIGVAGIQDAEIDQIVKALGAIAGSAPPGLLDKEPVNYFGTTVWRGYVQQPAAPIVGVASTHSRHGMTGAGVTVAVIDTGVDGSHPALAAVVTAGYDFTRNGGNGSESGDVDQSTMAVVDQAQPYYVNQSTMAVVDQSTMAVVDNPQYAALGHGTIVAGIVHLIAPRAWIMPLKAFRADGSGYSSDVLRAVYYAVRNGAKVLNMSFSYATESRELARAVEYATARGVIAVASTGNDGSKTVVYPAGLANVVGVASTTDGDTLSAFSNYGVQIAAMAAPGEAIVSTYLFGTYAAAWGTSFSTPFVAGAAALLAQVAYWITPAQAAEALGQAVWVSPEVRRGRLDASAAVQAWRNAVASP